jgi:hypothetical protein
MIPPGNNSPEEFYWSRDEGFQGYQEYLRSMLFEKSG